MKFTSGKNRSEDLHSNADIEAIYDRYAPRFLGLCYRYCGNREDAEDIMHDGFLNIIRNAHQFQSRGEGSLEAWMKRIMVTTSLKYLRDHVKYRKYLVFESVREENNFPEDEDEPSYPELSQPELLQLITELPLGYRTVFNFYVLENYSHKEIAGLLHCSENTSKTQLMKARAWLRKRIMESEKTEEYGHKESSCR
jgi:RNA polymerase sigma-70 factor (ECF subfamily)